VSDDREDPSGTHREDDEGEDEAAGRATRTVDQMHAKPHPPVRSR
jgi:hypothetical protein